MRLKGYRENRYAFVLLGLLLAVAAQPSAAAALRARTDVITLTNGDRVSGRIVYAQYGYLSLDTSHSSTIQIQWPSIRGVESRYSFRVVRFGGQHYSGALHTEGTNLVVGSGAEAASIPLAEVSSIVPFEASFWDRIDGSISVGYSFTKASEVSQGNIGFSANYSAENVEASVTGSSMITRDRSGETTDQEQVQGTWFFLNPSPNFWGLLGTLQRDRTMGVDGRAVAGAAFGRRLYQSIDAELAGIVGIDYNAEWASGGGGSHSSAEGVVGGEWRIYKFIYPKVSLDASLLLYPSITQSPRLRGTLNIALTLKLTERFKIKLSEYTNYDSRPPQAGAATTDYGVVTSLEYDFGRVIR